MSQETANKILFFPFHHSYYFLFIAETNIKNIEDTFPTKNIESYTNVLENPVSALNFSLLITDQLNTCETLMMVSYVAVEIMLCLLEPLE